MEKQYKSFGYSNGWKESPEEVQKCREQKHQKTAEKEGRGITKYTCHTCEIYWFTDSSD